LLQNNITWNGTAMPSVHMWWNADTHCQLSGNSGTTQIISWSEVPFQNLKIPATYIYLTNLLFLVSQS